MYQLIALFNKLKKSNNLPKIEYLSEWRMRKYKMPREMHKESHMNI
jgi:hypothetical protein